MLLLLLLLLLVSLLVYYYGISVSNYIEFNYSNIVLCLMGFAHWCVCLTACIHICSQLYTSVCPYICAPMYVLGVSSLCLHWINGGACYFYSDLLSRSFLLQKQNKSVNFCVCAKKGDTRKVKCDRFIMRTEDADHTQ